MNSFIMGSQDDMILDLNETGESADSFRSIVNFLYGHHVIHISKDGNGFKVEVDNNENKDPKDRLVFEKGKWRIKIKRNLILEKVSDEEKPDEIPEVVKCYHW